MKQEYPTKEEVERWRNLARADSMRAVTPRMRSWLEWIVRLSDAYLALREEVDELEWKAKLLCVELGNAFMEKTKLQADNEALREDYKEANVLLNGYDKLLTKLRDQRDKDQEEIRKFHADNEALREKLAQVEQASQRIIGNIIGEQTHGTY